MTLQNRFTTAQLAICTLLESGQEATDLTIYLRTNTIAVRVAGQFLELSSEATEVLANQYCDIQDDMSIENTSSLLLSNGFNIEYRFSLTDEA